MRDLNDFMEHGIVHALEVLAAENDNMDKIKVTREELLKRFKVTIHFNIIIPNPSDDDIMAAYHRLAEKWPGLLQRLETDD